MSGQLNVLAASYAVKESQTPIRVEAGWAQVLSGHYGKEKKSCPHQGLNPRHPAYSLYLYGTILAP